jgi:hypothetical protein
MTVPVTDGWITTGEAQALTGYTTAYARWLANQGKVEARKVGRDWLINKQSLLDHKAKMDAMGNQRHNPWREDLAEEERGRRKDR